MVQNYLHYIFQVLSVIIVWSIFWYLLTNLIRFSTLNINFLWIMQYYFLDCGLGSFDITFRLFHVFSFLLKLSNCIIIFFCQPNPGDDYPIQETSPTFKINLSSKWPKPSGSRAKIWRKLGPRKKL